MFTTGNARFRAGTGLAPRWGMALPSARRDPAASVLYQVVRDHDESFRAEATRLRDGEGLPRFVRAESEAFLGCGWLAGGFARFRCPRCREERLVAASVQGVLALVQSA